MMKEMLPNKFSGFAALCILFLTLVSSPVQAAGAKQDKEFPYTRQDIIKAYDDVMQQLIKVRPLETAQEQKGNAKYHDSFSYMLTPNVGIMLQCNKGGNKPTHVKAIAVDDGTKETQAFIVLNAMTLMTAVTPTWKGAERGAIAKALGITGPFPAVGKSESITAVEGNSQLNLTFANNGERGLTLTIHPE